MSGTLHALSALVRPYQGDDPYVFVSYSHRDKEAVHVQLEELVKGGTRVWYDEGIVPGQSWRDELAHAIAGASLFLYFITSDSARSRNCQRECNFAIDHEIPIVAVHLENTVLPDGLSFGISDQQAIMAHELGHAEYQSKLQEALDRYHCSGQDDGGSALENSQLQERPEARRTWIYALFGSALVVSLTLLWFLQPRSTVMVDLEPQLSLLMSTNENLGAASISHDGSMIAYIIEGDLHVRRLDGEQPIQLTDDDYLRGKPKFSPNGDRIILARSSSIRGQPDIVMIPTFGGDEKIIVNRATSPAWSFDGKSLAFIKFGDQNKASLVTASSDGSGLNELIAADATFPFAGMPSWSPDGSQIVFVRGIGGSSQEIWLIGSDGAGLRKLSDPAPGVYMSHPNFTFDGEAVIHVSNRGGGQNIWRTALDGSQSNRLTTGPGPDASPTVASDGSVLFLNSRWQARLLVKEGDETRSLLTHTQYLWAPIFSPDGQNIAFSRAETNGGWTIWVVGSDGSKPRRVSSGDKPHIYPRFTPDGEHLLYLEWVAGANRIFRIPRDGGAREAVTPEDVDAGYGDISPDGSKLAYTRRTSELERIVIRDLENGLERTLIDGPSTLAHWSPDGSMIAYTRDRSWENGIFVVNSDGSSPRRLADRGGWPTWWPDGSKIAYLDFDEDGNQIVQSVNLDGRPEDPLNLTFSGANKPIDISPDLRIVMTNEVTFDYQVWLLH